MAVKSGERGSGAAKLLALAAVSGGVGGVVLASRNQPPADVDELVTASPRARPPAKKPGGDPMAPAPEVVNALPPYPGSRPRKLIDSSASAEGHMQVAWFETNDSSAEVLSFYEKEFKRLNLTSMTGHFSETMGYTGWIERSTDGGADVAHMVSVMKQSGHTMVLLSASSPDEILAAPDIMPGGLKMPPQANRPRSLKMNLGEGDAQMFYSRATNTSTQEVRRFFEQQFTERGYQLQPRDEEGTVTARQGTLNIVVHTRDEGDRVNITVTYSQLPPSGAMP